MPQVFLRAIARNDLQENFIYLAEHAGLDIAERFLINAEISFNDLSLQPLIGSQLTLRQSELADIRKWPVRDFDHHLIFYQPRQDGVSIVRVLHAARDWAGLFEVQT